MKRSISQRRAQRGMTLLEVLVSILVFSFGILGMVGLQARAVQFSIDAEDRSRAAVLANEVVTAMWANQTLSPTAQIAALKARAQDPNDKVLFLSTAADVVVGAPSGGVVDVTITWKSPAAKRASDQISTYVTQVAMP